VFITVTIKMEADSRQELIDTFGSHVRQCQAHFEQLREEGAFGLPDKVEMRYLIIGGKWRAPKEQANDVSRPDNGTPEVE